MISFFLSFSSYPLAKRWSFDWLKLIFFELFLCCNSFLSRRADNPAKPNTSAKPMYESGLEYSINTTDTLLPKIEGSIDSIKSQLPQHPKGTSEKNEKNELKADFLTHHQRFLFFFYLIYSLSLYYSLLRKTVSLFLKLIRKSQ